MTDLRIVCTGTREHPHTLVEHGVVTWQPASFTEKGFAIWDGETRPRDMVMTSKSDTTRPNPDPDTVSRVVHRQPLALRARTDGGATVTIPECPRCGMPAREIRDDKLRAYHEAVRDTPRDSVLDLRDLVT